MNVTNMNEKKKINSEYSQSLVTFTDVEFISCTSTHSGGAMYIYTHTSEEIRLTNLSVNDCISDEGRGHSLFFYIEDNVGTIILSSPSFSYSSSDILPSNTIGEYVYIVGVSGVEMVEKEEWKEFLSDYDTYKSDVYKYVMEEENTTEERNSLKASLFHFRYDQSIDSD